MESRTLNEGRANKGVGTFRYFGNGDPVHNRGYVISRHLLFELPRQNRRSDEERRGWLRGKYVSCGSRLGERLFNSSCVRSRRARCVVVNSCEVEFVI